MNKSDGQDFLEVDWESAQLELQKQIEINNRKQEEENEKKKKEDWDILRKDLEEKYNKEKHEVEEKLRLQLSDYEQKIKEIKQCAEKSKIESERIHMETLLQERLKLLEAENARKKREYENREKSEIQKKEKLQKQNLNLHNSQKLEQTLRNLMRKLNKMKIIISELKRNVNLDIHLTKNFNEYLKDKSSLTQVEIKVLQHY